MPNKCVGCVGAFLDCVRRPVLGDDDSPDTVRVKTIIVNLGVVVVPSMCLVLMMQHSTVVQLLGPITGVLSQLAVYVGWHRCPKLRLESLALAGYLLAILFADLNSLSRGDRRWPLTVLVMDCALVTDLPRRHTLGMMAVVVVYLVLVTADSAVAGLYRDAGSGVVPWVCDCDDPPCLQPVGGAANAAFWTCFVFLCDFFLTRGFASGLRHQMAVVQQAIGVVEQIAQQLARYEVEEGRAVLQSDESAKLPDGLREALLRLLDNLDEYRPFLPESMLVREGVDLSTAEPPGLGQAEPTVTMCFTDIQSSTELWEAYPQGMHTALQTHNDVMRTVAKCSGYEVKVIGDAFMLAFKSAEDGCRFALDAQEALAEAKWPSELLQHPLCTPVVGEDGRMLWGGPRVRIGVNCGAVRVEKNPVTGRCDYFGPPVNTAARVEACLRHGGLTGVTKAVLDELTPAAMDSLGRPVLVPLGEKELKGVGERVEVTVLLNRHHAERERCMRDETYVGRHVRRRWTAMRSDSDGWSSISGRSGGTRHEPVLRERMLRRMATCSSFRAAADSSLTPLTSALEQMLEAVEQAADMTQGLVVGTMSLQCTAVWNGPRVCGDHYGQCLRASDIFRRCGLDASAGACSGELLYGSVAAGRRKHATVVGGCVELSAALAEGAEMCGEAVLAAATFGAYCGTQHRAHRCSAWAAHSGGSVDVWVLTPPVAADAWWGAAREENDLEHEVDDGLLLPNCRVPDRVVLLVVGVAQIEHCGSAANSG